MSEQTTPATDPFEMLVARHLHSIKSATDSYDEKPIRDPRCEPTVVTIKKRFAKPYTEKRYVTHVVTDQMAFAYHLLRNRRDIAKDLNLPTGSPIPDQIDAAIDQFMTLVDRIKTRGVSVFASSGLPEHQQALELAAQMAALVDLAEQRAAVVHNLDPESIRRTAQALVDDLNAARELLSTDKIDRELARTSA